MAGTAISATKKYASPVNYYEHTKKYPSKAFRRIARERGLKEDRQRRRSRKRHPSKRKGMPGLPYRVSLECRPKDEPDAIHATGALKRSERHPRRDQFDREWQYVCR